MPGKIVYTTSDISKLCRVSLSTVINWVNHGKLHAFETPGGHRRIRKEDLSKFLRTYNMPLFHETDAPSPQRILIVDEDSAASQSLTHHLQLHAPQSDIRTAHDAFEIGSAIVSFRPDLVILFTTLPGIDAAEVCRRIKSLPETHDTKIVTVGDRGENSALGADASVDLFVPGASVETLMPQLLSLLGLVKKGRARNGAVAEK